MNAIPAVSAIALATFLATGVSAQCNVILVGTGTYKLEVKTGGPVPVVDFKKASGPIWQFNRRGSPAQCDKRPDLSTVALTKSRNASDLLYHVANELRAAATVEWASSQRPTIDYPYRDFVTLADAVREDALVMGLRAIVAQIASDLILKHAKPFDVLKDKGAQWVAETAATLMLQAYVEGKDPGLIIDGLLGRMVDYLKKQAGTLVDQQAGNAIVAGAVKQLLNLIAKDLKALLVEKFPSEQWVRVETGGEEECSHALHISWDLKGGQYRAVFTAKCGKQQPDWVASVVVTAPSVKPGEAGTVTVQALNQLGVAFPLSNATINGLAAVMPDGSAEPKAAVAGRTATFNYTAAKPRRDGTYALVINVVTDNSTGLLTGNENVTVMVENVPPTIESVTPGDASAEPGQQLQLNGARVLVVDDNADARNAGEVSVGSLKLAHPAGLKTTPLFDRADNPARVSFDAGSGAYVFQFSRSGLVEDPHVHGVWPAAITMSDVDGQVATSSVNLEVIDVKPVIDRITASPRFVHVMDGQVISVTARFSDKNGIDDLVAYSIDASKAGGAVYTPGNGLTETGRGASYVEVRVTTPFGHPDVEGRYPVDGLANDEKNNVTSSDFINVGNIAPTISGTGYIYGGDGVPVTDKAIVKDAPSNLCPNDPFRVGLILSDVEGDTLTATVTIVETGQTFDLRNSSDNISDCRSARTSNAGQVHAALPGQREAARHEGRNGPARIDRAPVRRRQPARAGHRAAGEPNRHCERAARPGLADVPQLLRQNRRALHAAAGARRPGRNRRRDRALRSVGSERNQPGTASRGVPDRPGQFHRAGRAILRHQPRGSTHRATGGRARARAGAHHTRRTDAHHRAVAEGGRWWRRTTDRGCVLPGVPAPAARRGHGTAHCRQRFAAAVRAAHQGARCREQIARAEPAQAGHRGTDYFHSIRQWSIWTLEERFDLRRFTEGFVQVTRRNYQSAGEAWNDEVEKAVRATQDLLEIRAKELLGERGPLHLEQGHGTEGRDLRPRDVFHAVSTREVV